MLDRQRPARDLLRGHRGCGGEGFAVWSTSAAHTISGVWGGFKPLPVVFVRNVAIRHQRRFVRQKMQAGGARHAEHAMACSALLCLALCLRNQIRRGLWTVLPLNAAPLWRVSPWVLPGRCLFQAATSSPGRVSWGKHASDQPRLCCKRAQSKPGPGSCLRPGAMCSCPARWAIG